MEKNKYTRPQSEITEFDALDVVTLSGTYGEGKGETPTDEDWD